MKKAFTFVELLVTLIITSITFSIIYLIVTNTLDSYKISKTNVRTLYAESSISLLFDILDDEVKFAGSGSELLKNLYVPTYIPRRSNSYVQKGRLFTEIVDHGWLINSIDYYEDKNQKIFYLTYVVTYPVFFVRNNDGTYSPLYNEKVGEIQWAIIKNKLSPDTEGYYTRYAKLKVTKLSGSGTYPGEVKIDDKFSIREVNLANPNRTVELTSDDKYIYPIYNSTDLFAKSFRQIRVIYDKTLEKVSMIRYYPMLDITNNTVEIDLINDVKDFSISVIYFDNGIKEMDINTAKNSIGFDTTTVIGLKFTIVWQPNWKKEPIIKSRTINIVSNM
ncbi:prepilin-type N-terminal cleavage/methylation domain-containing protein [Thermosipho atlanticus]|uniref:Prepilin-type N-terminal cleavage/methylation domain-containing protein n=1 Tax=Thermosipho atlanticus DSM 15807 TaxID=1123380 RepID=A0A1M5RRP9_9BACT|nr:prepilin-type N-terminal cleavage/methylation domain-containing protein [Thermosipho atlanticus]SHH28954.1 prepilin-type N-terminal cleavage/methylation domain-containing protein [Thermosipho atlanticus DSM 15807]